MSKIAADLTAPGLSFRRAWQFAWDTYRQRASLFIALLLTLVGVWVALEVVVIAGQDLGLGLWAAAHLVFLLFCGGLLAGLLKLCLALHDSTTTPTFTETFEHLALGPRFLAALMAYLLLVVVGLILLIIPGLYLGAHFVFFGCALAAGDDVLASFRRSARLTSGLEARLALFLLALLATNLLGAAVLGLGLLLTIPLSLLTLTALYRQLAGRLSPKSA